MKKIFNPKNIASFFGILFLLANLFCASDKPINKNPLVIVGGKFTGDPKSDEGAKFTGIEKIEIRVVDEGDKVTIDQVGDTVKVVYLDNNGDQVGKAEWLCVCEGPLGSCRMGQIIDIFVITIKPCVSDESDPCHDPSPCAGGSIIVGGDVIFVPQ